MGKIVPTKPLLVLLYGFPGSGKTFLARQLCEQLVAVHVHGDRMRSELFETPTYNKEEGHVITSLMQYMTGEFLNAGVSVVYDTNALRTAQRRALRNMAAKAGAETVLIWLQIDPESAYSRVSRRDRRKIDDKFSQPLDRNAFDALSAGMQNPDPVERYLVVSGKHVFSTQRSAILRHLLDRKLIALEPNAQHIGKPGLVNLVPNPAAGRVDFSRRNIIIR
ncbi:MAG TPA: ATP-binding protein [Candidatus Saccharimonadales bacterium]|nr:ATP-binding protein [Candidatus Saccharimonadales bacterium]